MSTFPIPPTYANPIIKDGKGNETFNPLWLRWFLDMAQALSIAGSATILHNSTGSLQGGTAGEYYHVTAAEHAAIADGPTQPPTSGAAGASPYTYQNVSGFTQLVVLTGGAVTDVSFSRDNITFYSAGATPTAFVLARADYVVLTHAGAPVVTTFDL